MNGIDISRWQPANVTELVKDYDFVIIKATEGTSYVSPFCDSQYQKAKARGKKLGVYHFASGLNPEAEADYFVNNVQGYIGEAILVLDWEANAISLGADWVRRFVRQVKARTNVPPLIYGSASPLSTHGIPQVAQEENCGLWVAAYPNANPTGYRDEPQLLGSVIRQYASTGRLEGYDGNLDLNSSVLTPEQWDKYAVGGRGSGEAPTPPPQPARKSNEQVADEVLAGAWGNGEDRKNRLSAAGYDPTVIQGIVNNKLNVPPAKKSNDQVANEVIQGLWGNGVDRVNKLSNAGYDPRAIQDLVNQKTGSTAPAQQYFTVPSGSAGYLGNISARFGTPVATLVSWNKGKYPRMSANYVEAGWVIRVK